MYVSSSLLDLSSAITGSMAGSNAILPNASAAKKRARLLRAARHYLSRLAVTPPCRFDALLIEGEPPRIEWVRNAFDA